ncbi:thiamine pyrophosphate-binding protein [Amycolatopsis alkalitolerans]|uniref:thiamine pyrophosphate-binding protein n=1 Tax=Amycolatopsis alkalitolerans TaxID=2547244 RepID=UPI001F37EB7B|nr:thiamine pyrophosphate-binding protein [Amycolatopsis alkalitolerans]
MPDDFEFRLALHEGSVVGMATGWAMARGRPAFVNLHTTAGLANAAGALATARTNRVPLVVVVGQQDRRHLAHDPFLAGRLDGLLGEYPVWTNQPARAQDVPAAIARAHHEAVTAAGPALVVVPMDDWLRPAEPLRGAAPLEVRRAAASMTDEIDDLATILDAAASPVLVAGSGAADESSWAALVALAERLGSPVWQEPFGARAGFPQDHRLFAGHLPPGWSGVRAGLAGHDVLLVVGAPVLRQYPWEPGELAPEDARCCRSPSTRTRRTTAWLTWPCSPTPAGSPAGWRNACAPGTPPRCSVADPIRSRRRNRASRYDRRTSSTCSRRAFPATPSSSRSHPPTGRNCTAASPPATHGDS